MGAPYCHGNGPDHCCHLGKYGVCQFLEENTVPGRRWACGLYRIAGSWDKVHTSKLYLVEVKPKLVENNVGGDCGDWPQNIPGRLAEGGQGLCGWTGDG